MSSLPALPIVPPRLGAEALGSWLGRVARIYDLDAHRLLDEWIAPLPALPGQQRMSVEARLTPRHLQTIAPALRLLAGAIEPLPDQAAAWLLHSDSDLATCPQCLIHDDRQRHVRHRRAAWMQAWRVTCDVHRRLLVHLPDWPTADLRAWRCPAVAPRRTALGRPASQAGTRLRTDATHPPVSGAIRALDQIERAIGSALAGRAPERRDWGGLDAETFLQVVRDVTTFVLARFGDRPCAPICTMDVGRFRDRAPVRCFARPANQCIERAKQPAELVWAGNVGLRRCALFWARELMHARTARAWLERSLKNARPERQERILRRQSAEGLDWLAARMSAWPETYRHRWWSGMRRITGT